MSNKIEAHIAKLQAVMNGPGGRYWAYTPAVSALIAALEQAQQRIAELEASHLPSVPALYLCRVFRNGEELYSPCGKDYPRGRAYYTRASQLAVPMPRHKTHADYVDGEFTNEDLAMVYNSCLLECKVKIRNAGGTVQGDE